jgi:hypothetical protein
MPITRGSAWRPSPQAAERRINRPLIPAVQEPPGYFPRMAPRGEVSEPHEQPPAGRRLYIDHRPAPTRLPRLRSGPDGPDEDVLNDLATPQELCLAEQEPGRSTLPGGRSGHGWR